MNNALYHHVDPPRIAPSAISSKCGIQNYDCFSALGNHQQAAVDGFIICLNLVSCVHKGEHLWKSGGFRYCYIRGSVLIHVLIAGNTVPGRPPLYVLHGKAVCGSPTCASDTNWYNVHRLAWNACGTDTFWGRFWKSVPLICMGCVGPIHIIRTVSEITSQATGGSDDLRLSTYAG